MKKRRYARKIIDKKTYYLSIILVVMLIIITIYWSDKLLNKTTIAVVSDNATDINNSKNNMNTENKKNEEISGSESNAESNSEVETEKPTEGKITDWNLILVNKNNSIPENYTVNLREVEYGHSVDERIADSLTNMLSDAKKQQHHIFNISIGSEKFAKFRICGLLSKNNGLEKGSPVDDGKSARQLY